MTVETTDAGDGVVLLHGSGELDIAVVPDLLPTVGPAVAGARAVVLDLTDVTFFDSSGVRLVDRLVREAARAGATLKVVAPRGGPVRRVLELVGMAGPFVVDDLPTAMQDVRAGA
jgi:anti-anti-sigma factor